MIETLRAVVHPWHCDIMGHLCTRHYVGFFDDAGFQLVAACGVHVVPGEANGFADVRACYEYKLEVSAGGLIYVESSFLKVGRTSFTARHEMRRVSDAQVVATAEVTSVCFDLRMRRAVPITDELRGAAERLLPGATP